MGSRVELFEQIRRDRDREGLSIRALAERHGVHRRAVRQALVSPVPPAKRPPSSRPAPRLGAYRALIDAWLEGDRDAPRKQRHTAKRIWRRLVDEHGADVAETTVRDYVRSRKRAMGWPIGEVFVPQVHAPGVLAEVDWGEAQIELAGVATRVHLFLMRASFSGAAFCQASLVETQQAFLELHVEAFEWFGGIFEQIRFDNLGSAVKQVLKGRRRVETDRFIALRSHYLFCSQFTTPGIQGAHEKGGVEARSGASAATTSSPSRRSPTWASSTRGCSRAATRTCAGGSSDAARRSARHGRRSARGCAAAPRSVRRDRDRGAARGRQVAGHGPPEPLLGPGRPRRAEGQRADRREGDRDQPRRRGDRASRAAAWPLGTSAQLDRYLELLARKPGGLQHSLALAQERERGTWPAAFDELWTALTGRYGRSEAARQVVDVLMLCREHEPGHVALAVRGALAAGAIDGRAVQVLAESTQTAPAPLSGLEPRLAAHARPAPDLADYDQLLGGPR
jgi:transposase